MASAVVMFNHGLQSRHTAIVHIGCGQGDIAQARHPESPVLVSDARHAAPAPVFDCHQVLARLAAVVHVSLVGKKRGGVAVAAFGIWQCFGGIEENIPAPLLQFGKLGFTALYPVVLALAADQSALILGDGAGS